MATTKPGSDAVIAVFCLDEQREIGQLMVTAPARVKLTAAVFSGRFKPDEDKYAFTAKPGRDGGYVHCPRCTGKLAISGALRVKGKPDLRDIKVPIILGSTIVEVLA